MKIKIILTAALTAVCMISGCSVTPQPTETPTAEPTASPTPVPTPTPTPGPVVRFGTGGIAGVYYSYGKAIGKVLSSKLGIPFNISQTEASKANIKLIEDGNADIGFAQNDVMYYALNGTDFFAEDGAMSNFSAIGACYDSMCHVAAVKGINSIEELKGKNISVGSWESGTCFNARQILDAYGITFDDVNVNTLSFEDSINALREGRIDAFFCTAGIGSEAIEVPASEGRINLLPIDTAHTEILVNKYPYYSANTIPQGRYSGIDEAVPTVSVKSVIIASNKMKVNDVYDITKALFESKKEISQNNPFGAELDAKYAASGLSVEIHPGAAYYYREIGVLPPLEETPEPSVSPEITDEDKE